MRVIRVLFGFAVACIAAAATLVLFVYTPVELATLPAGLGADRLGEGTFFALVITPHVASFAALPTLIAVIFGERRGIAEWSYYAVVGVAIAALGFLTQHFTEAPGQTTILHNYALMAFLCAGVVGGLAYWLCSGRYARRTPANGPRHPTTAPPPSAEVAGRSA